MKKIVIPLIILLILAAGAYWYFFLHGPGQTATPTGSNPTTGFSPFGRTTSNKGQPGNNNNSNTSTSTASIAPAKIPSLRLLSNAPVGGYGASTTNSLPTG